MQNFQKIFIISVCVLFCFILFGCSNNNSLDNSTSNSDNNSFNNTVNEIATNRVSYTERKEEPLSEFTTTIYDADEERQTNMTLACNTLNGTVVKSGETFSFCDTLGPARPEDGYQKAEVFESDGDIIHDYGGGKCQISSTLYNAVLAVPNLVVLERHSHSRKVMYVPERKGRRSCLW